MSTITKPKLTLVFETEDELMNFMATCSVLALKKTIPIPDSTKWKVDHVKSMGDYLQNVNKKIDELKGE